MENDFTKKYRAKLANSKAMHETRGSLKRMGVSPHEKALGNVLKGKNIEGKKGKNYVGSAGHQNEMNLKKERTSKGWKPLSER